MNLAVKLSEAKLVFHVHAVILSFSSSSSLLSLPLNRFSSLMFLISSPSGPSLIGCGSPKLWESGANGNGGGMWAGLSLVDLQRDAPSGIIRGWLRFPGEPQEQLSRKRLLLTAAVIDVGPPQSSISTGSFAADLPSRRSQFETNEARIPPPSSII